VFVTIDPERDTPQLLKSYLANFDPSFVALRGTPEQTQAAAKEFKVFYAKVPGKTPGSYTMDHTAGSYVFDTDGRVRLFTRYGTGASALASDIKALLAQG
jgi:protein SCO1/2